MRLALIFSLLSIVGCATAMSKDGKLSAGQLLSDVKKYDGKRVVAEGFLRWEMEDFCLYETREDMRLEKIENSVWLEAKPGYEASSLNGKKVIVVGVFSKNEVGHMSMWKGGVIVESIKAVENK